MMYVHMMSCVCVRCNQVVLESPAGGREGRRTLAADGDADAEVAQETAVRRGAPLPKGRPFPEGTKRRPVVSEEGAFRVPR